MTFSQNNRHIWVHFAGAAVAGGLRDCKEAADLADLMLEQYEMRVTAYNAQQEIDAGRKPRSLP